MGTIEHMDQINLILHTAQFTSIVLTNAATPHSQGKGATRFVYYTQKNVYLSLYGNTRYPDTHSGETYIPSRWGQGRAGNWIPCRHNPSCYSTCTATRLCHAPFRQWHGCTMHSGATGTQGLKYNDDLHPYHDKNIGIYPKSTRSIGSGQ
jgi:hypothetical protein